MTNLKALQVVLLFALQTTMLYSQHHHKEWHFGYSGTREGGYGVSSINFYESGIDTSYVFSPSFDFGVNGTVSHDLDGRIDLYTEGCKVYNQYGESISGDSYIFPGLLSEDYCSDSDYPSVEANIFLPRINNDSSKILISTNAVFIGRPLYIVADTMVIIKLSRLSSEEDYRVINRVAVSIGNTSIGRISVIRTADSLAHWVCTYNLDPSELVVHRIDQTGKVDTVIRSLTNEIASSTKNVSFQSAFSASGDQFAMVVEEEGLRVYDFDRTTGRFDNLRVYPMPDSSFNTRGVIFSPNGRYVYTTYSVTLYQTDLLTGQNELIARHDADRSPRGWPITMGNMRLGPDCRIYVGPSSTVEYLHVIHAPNEAGQNCDFQFRAIETPTRIHFQLPNLPMTMDTTQCRDLPWILEPSVSTTAPSRPSLLPVTLSPNPVTTRLRLDWPGVAQTGPGPFRWRLFGLDGTLLRDVVVTNGTEITLGRPGLPAGSYAWELLGAERKIGAGMVVLR